MKTSKLELLTSKPADVFDDGILIGKGEKNRVPKLSVHHITIMELGYIGEEKYNEYLSLLLFDKSSIDTDTIDDLITEFEISIINSMHNDKFCKNMIDSLSFFLKEPVYFFHTNEYGFFYLGDIDTPRIISKNDYFLIRDIVREFNCIEKTTKPETANKIADDFLKEIEAMKNKYKKIVEKNKNKDVISIADLVSAVVWKGNRSYDEVLGFTVYRLYDSLNQIKVIDKYTFTMQGVYSGSLNTKSMNKELETINWIK